MNEEEERKSLEERRQKWKVRELERENLSPL